MKRAMKQFIGIIMPQAVHKRLRSHFERQFRNQRELREKQIPKVSLSKKHMGNCELLLDRSALLSKMKKEGIVAEIGVNKGDFSSKILKTTKPNLLHLIDMWAWDRYHQGLFESVKSKFDTDIEKGKVLIHRSMSTEAVHQFRNNYFDWIYIDTDHSYETTREELASYAPKVKRNGVIAGHDYSMGNWTKTYRYGVIEAVHEFCVEHDWELIYLTLEPKELQSFAIRRIRGGETWAT